MASSDRDDPLSAVWPAAVASGSLVGQHVAGKATRDTLFLTHFGLGLLPAAMIGAALVSSVAVIGISRMLTKYSPARMVPIIFGVGAALFLGEWWLALHDERTAAVAVYAHTAIFSSASVSAFWSLINERFDPHVAKKIVGRIASGGTVGGVLGGVLVWRASEHLSVPMMLALLAGMNVIGLWGALRTVAGDKQGTGPAPEPIRGGGLAVVRETPYLRDLALLVLTGAVIQALLDWLLSAHASAMYGKGPPLLAFFALYNMIVGVASFAAQTGLARPLLERLGLAGTVKWQPITVGLFGALALVAPRLTTVVVLRGAEAVMRNSLYRSAYELFYTPLPTGKKRATKTLIDVGVDRVGTTLGSLALLAIVRLDIDVATRVVLVVAIVTAGAALWISARLHDGYVNALASSLKSGAVRLDDDDPQDLTTKKTLAETTALLDRDKLLARIEQFQREKEGAGGAKRVGGTTQVAAAAEAAPASVAPDGESKRTLASLSAPIEDPLLARANALRGANVAKVKSELVQPLPSALVPFAIPLLSNDAVVRDAVRALRKVAPKVTGQLIDALLDTDVDPRVRRRIPRVLKVCRTQRAASGLLLALRDPVFEVRVQVGLALAQMHDEANVSLPREEVFDVAVHELTTGKASWSTRVSEPSAPPRAPAADVVIDDPSHLASLDAAYRSNPPPRESVASGDDLHRGLAHVFTILGLVLEREPLTIAYRALRSEEASLRGTAYEYLEVVLPPRVRDVLVPLLGDVKPTAARARDRGSKELADELLRSNASLPRPSRTGG
ncbi:MAG: hypothetical protein JST00_08055 [Deltaproteobacteria bacterium]|nr:hypothetical protein [Deltaproteobacteria bacterium]